MRSAIRAGSEAQGAGTDGKVSALLDATRQGFLLAMDDDFNTPDAVYRLMQMTEALRDLEAVSRKEGRQIVALFRELGAILGLFSDLGPDARAS